MILIEASNFTRMTSRELYFYCLDIADIESAWSLISEDEWKYRYCKNVYNRDIVASSIKSEKWQSLYCSDIKYRDFSMKHDFNSGISKFDMICIDYLSSL